DKLLKALLALDWKAGAAATQWLVSLNAHVFGFGGLAGEVNSRGIALQVRAIQVALGELLARVAHPAGGGDRVGLHVACADRLVSSLQQSLAGNLVRVWRRRLCHRRPDQQGG